MLLRDGSGAQSTAARALPHLIRTVADGFLASLAERGETVVGVLAHHGGQVQLSYLRALKSSAKSCQSFLWQHYLLVLDVLGADSTGSLGYQVASMAQRAARPLLPELDQALYDFAKLTDLYYAPHGGRLVLANERAAGWDPVIPARMLAQECPADVMSRTVHAYFSGLAARDTGGWTSLFDADEGRLVEFLGTRPFIGRARLSVFVETMFRTFPTMRPTVERLVRTSANSMTAQWSIDAVSYLGAEVRLRGTEELVFTSEGQILQAVTDWNAAEVSHALWPEVVQTLKSLPPADSYQPGPHRRDHRGGAVRRPEFQQDGTHQSLGTVRRDTEGTGDLLVTQPLAQQTQGLVFPRG